MNQLVDKKIWMITIKELWSVALNPNGDQGGVNVHGGSVLGLAVFNIFVDDMDSGIESSLSKFSVDTELCGAVNTLEGRDAIKKELDRVERWVHVNLMEFNNARCKILHMGWGNPKHEYRLDGEWIESSLEEKDLGALSDKKLSMTRQCSFAAPRANHILSCIKRTVASRSREMIFPFSCSHETPPGEVCSVLGLST
ncbi:hypothetical protein HGM15179_000828 [Zosterops borbonicus]|uniref:Rna-directed dna polymerase from mobile element jockey-like n=1 Tax=Zosterops borbonicus TaxID=364589 RepID=A0A8K1GYJ5_9PASS|nr:hypothetical protein HGM15179_000828 [Zosterops borbonicus]